jgi:hypothetical protein
MSNITSSKMVVFVYYKINPLNSAFEDSLGEHLLSEVCMKRNGWGECINVIIDKFKSPKYITEVRYQFGSDFDEDMIEEVGELIDNEINRWAAKTKVAEMI